MAIAIIAEYNPFHNGHIYQLNYAKKNFPNDKIVVILSGKYVQRGEIAIASFRQRKKMALKYGASKVIKLPFKYATQAAHVFAGGAIKIINKNKITKLLFGSESNDIDQLIKIAKTIKNNQAEYKKILKANLKLGYSFPKSAGIAVSILTKKTIKMPNDILALEYIKAIIDNNYSITPYSLKRVENDGSTNIYASASHIRELIKKNKDVQIYTPMKFKYNKLDLIESHYKKFQKIVKNTSVEKLRKIQLVSEGMEYLFKKHIDAQTYDEFVNKTNSKRYTSSRIKRTMLYILLKIK